MSDTEAKDQGGKHNLTFMRIWVLHIILVCLIVDLGLTSRKSSRQKTPNTYYKQDISDIRGVNHFHFYVLNLKWVCYKSLLFFLKHRNLSRNRNRLSLKLLLRQRKSYLRSPSLLSSSLLSWARLQLSLANSHNPKIAPRNSHFH